MIRVMIADDEMILREGIKFIIETDPEIKVVGCAYNGLEAISMCESLLPHVILMDIKMPRMDGIKATKMIKDKNSQVKIMILTTLNSDEDISLALENGADGYILKDLNAENLILSIKGCVNGLKIIHKDTMPSIVKQVSGRSKISFIRKDDKDINLTQREFELVSLIGQGRDNKEISEAMFISEGSVRNMISKVLRKLELRDRIQLAVFAAKNDIV